MTFSTIHTKSVRKKNDQFSIKLILLILLVAATLLINLFVMQSSATAGVLEQFQSEIAEVDHNLNRPNLEQ